MSNEEDTIAQARQMTKFLGEGKIKEWQQKFAVLANRFDIERNRNPSILLLNHMESILSSPMKFPIVQRHEIFSLFEKREDIISGNAGFGVQADRMFDRQADFLVVKDRHECQALMDRLAKRRRTDYGLEESTLGRIFGLSMCYIYLHATDRDGIAAIAPTVAAYLNRPVQPQEYKYYKVETFPIGFVEAVSETLQVNDPGRRRIILTLLHSAGDRRIPVLLALLHADINVNKRSQLGLADALKGCRTKDLIGSAPNWKFLNSSRWTVESECEYIRLGTCETLLELLMESTGGGAHPATPFWESLRDGIDKQLLGSDERQSHRFTVMNNLSVFNSGKPRNLNQGGPPPNVRKDINEWKELRDRIQNVNGFVRKMKSLWWAGVFALAVCFAFGWHLSRLLAVHTAPPSGTHIEAADVDDEAFDSVENEQ